MKLSTKGSRFHTYGKIANKEQEKEKEKTILRTMEGWGLGSG